MHERTDDDAAERRDPAATPSLARTRSSATRGTAITTVANPRRTRLSGRAA